MSMRSVIKNITLLGGGVAFGSIYTKYNLNQFVRDESPNDHQYHNFLSSFEFQHFSIIKKAYNSMKAVGYENFFLKCQNKLEGFKYLEYFAHPETISHIVSSEESNSDEIKKIGKLGCVFEVTDNLQGHSGYAHGGLIATLFDTNFSHVTIISTKMKSAMTAYLNISYRKPLRTNQKYVMLTEVDRIEGRKYFLKGKIFNEKEELITEADCMFIVVRQPMKLSPFLSAIKTVLSFSMPKESMDSEPEW